MCVPHKFQLDDMCATHIITPLHLSWQLESIVKETSLTPEHEQFFEWFKSFWAAPSGQRVAERFPPDAKIHFTGNPTISGAEYIDYMDGMLGAFPGMTVTPLECAGNGEMLYIAWQASNVVHGQPRTFLGVDRFRIVDGMAVEEHVIFDSAVLQVEGRPGIDH
jgi:SnoaL-like domain